MTERPILFSGPMVRAILEDRKTQTRRVVKPLPDGDQHIAMCGTEWLYAFDVAETGEKASTNPRRIRWECPYGQPGDRLWVRERHCYLDVTKSNLSKFPLGAQNNNEVGPNVWNVTVEYSDGTERPKSVEGKKPKQTRARGDDKWRPSMFMHHWASRITLEVTGVRAERLQEIPVDDAIAEGLLRHVGELETWWGSGADGENSGLNTCDWLSPIECYRNLWDSLNAKRGVGWDKNPWVWVVEFKRLPA